MPLIHGEELIQIIRKNKLNSATQIIIASGYSNKLHEYQAKIDKDIFLLKKPFTKDHLLENILELFK
jgi:CheY-like chemotaxis protein